jgi:hypothetical protein
MTGSEHRIRAIEIEVAKLADRPSYASVLGLALCEIARQLKRSNDLKEFELGFGDKPEIEIESDRKPAKPDTKFSKEFLQTDSDQELMGR